jgi:hypothetical protein
MGEAGVSVGGTAACSVAAQSGVGEAFPEGAIKDGSPWDGILQLIETRIIRIMGINFFTSTLYYVVRGTEFISFKSYIIFREIAIVHIAAPTRNPAIQVERQVLISRDPFSIIPPGNVNMRAVGEAALTRWVPDRHASL